MEHLNPKDPQSIARIEAVIVKIAPKWKAQPNIIDIVPALRTKAGKVKADELVIGFHVTDKIPPELLTDRGYEPIPSEIEGIPTDVILARGRALGNVDCKNTRSQMFDTLVGGIAVGNANMNAYGTLGMTLLAESDGRLVGLTNEHVLVYDSDGHVGDEVQQPRYYLWSEVSLDNADCCPNGQLHYRGVDNPIIDAAGGVFAASALAAALSDEIDPHRRGQVATIPELDELTMREVVSVALDYTEIPFPGHPYKVGAKWTYQRHTDRRVLEHKVSETKQNEHVLDYQQLITDKRRYLRGETVTLVAVLGSERGERICHNYFVTAAALSQSHRRAYKIILKPVKLQDGAGSVSAASMTHGSEGHQLKDNTVRRCYSFSDQKPFEQFRASRTIDGITYDPRGHTAEFVVTASGGPVALRFPAHGLVARFHLPVQRVIAHVEVINDPIEGSTTGNVTMTAYSGNVAVGSAATTAPGPADLNVSAASIDYVVFRGGMNQSLLLGICIEVNLGHFCSYLGQLQLAPDEELGQWKTFLFAQTRNDVGLGIDPTVAAQTIGGWLVTNNFVSTGGSDSLTYGHQCNVDIVPTGDFEVL
jgi:hypothetical protein